MNAVWLQGAMGGAMGGAGSMSMMMNPGASAMPGSTTLTLLVPDANIGRVIGKGGATVAEIRTVRCWGGMCSNAGCRTRWFPC